MRTRATILRRGQHAAAALADDGAPRDDRSAQILRREVLTAKREAEALIDSAKKRAQELLQESQLQAQNARTAAEKAGFDAGLALAAEQAVRIARKEEELDQRALSRSIEIARLLAERVVGKTLSESPEALAEMARAALEEVRGARQVRFLVAPDDVPCITRALARDVGSPMLVQVEAHPDLERGDFEMRTDKGVLSAKLGERLRLLAKVLAERLG